MKHYMTTITSVRAATESASHSRQEDHLSAVGSNQHMKQHSNKVTISNKDHARHLEEDQATKSASSTNVAASVALELHAQSKSTSGSKQQLKSQSTSQQKLATKQQSKSKLKQDPSSGELLTNPEIRNFIKLSKLFLFEIAKIIFHLHSNSKTKCFQNRSLQGKMLGGVTKNNSRTHSERL